MCFDLIAYICFGWYFYVIPAFVVGSCLYMYMFHVRVLCSCSLIFVDDWISHNLCVFSLFSFLVPFSVCNRTWFGDVGKTYEMEIDKPKALPFVCHLNFTAPGGSHGDIIQVSDIRCSKFDTVLVSNPVTLYSIIKTNNRMLT